MSGGRFKVLIIFFVLILVLVTGCWRQEGTDPVQKTAGNRADEGQGLPETTACHAGIEVKTGGGEAGGGAVHLCSFDLGGGTFDYVSGDKLFSPDGKRIAFQAVRKNGAPGLWVMALDGSQGRLLTEVDERDFTTGAAMIRLLGWDKDNNVVFVRQGYQSDGDYKGKRGICVYKASPENAKSREVAWLAVPKGTVHDIILLPEKEEVYVHITGALKRVNLKSGSVEELAEKLPSYDGLFNPRLSPPGDYYVYVLFDPGKSGIYLLDTADGSEKELVRNRETWNFYPHFSPDGKYLAYYKAQLKKGSPGKNAGDYELLLMEDGPAPAAAGIEISSLGGGGIAYLSVCGSVVGNFQWSPDSKHIVFTAGIIKETSDAGGFPGFLWNSLWIADLQGKVKKLADFEGSPASGATILNISGKGRVVHYMLYDQENYSLWAVEEGAKPVKLQPPGADAWNVSYPVPSHGKIFFLKGVVSGQEDVFIVYGRQVTRVTVDGGTKSFVEAAGGCLVYVREGSPGAGSKMVILSLPGAGYN